MVRLICFRVSWVNECFEQEWASEILTAHRIHVIIIANGTCNFIFCNCACVMYIFLLITLCKIWGSRGGDYEECRLLGCDTVWLLWEPIFQRNALSPSSEWNLIMEVIRSFETSVLTRAIRRNIKEDGILHRLSISYLFTLEYRIISALQYAQSWTRIQLEG
jgi:hypothetical protein